MGLMDFVKNAGEKLFGSKKVEEAAAASSPDLATLNAEAGDAIKAYIEAQGLELQNLSVSFDGADGTATLNGDAPSREAYEKAALSAGNVEGVRAVVNNLTVPNDTPEAQYHDVVSGDNLSKIAKQYYGDPNKYPVIFEANKPMLTHPDKIYPGQKLRIPAL